MPDQNELLSLLDLSGRDAPAAPGGGVEIDGGGTAAPTAPASPTALTLDRWGLRRGSELLTREEPNERLAKALRLDDDNTNVAQAGYTCADLFGAAFEPEPQLAERCVDPTRHEFLTQLLETPEYHELHSQTTLDEAASELAATHFAESFGKLRQDRERDESAPPGKGKDTGDPAMRREMQCLRAVASALKGAAEDVGEMQDACRGLGHGPGGDGKMDPQKVAALFKRVRGNAQLKRICELAGRYRRLAQARQRQKTLHGYDDMVGVEPGGDVGRLLPHELAALASDDADVELDALRRLAEKQSMCRQFEGVELVGKGPIVVVVDESGSMSGEPVCTAKALCLAMGWIARHQRRWVAFVAFSGGTEGRTLALPPGRWDEPALLDWLEGFLSGGTTVDVPLVELPNVYWPKFCEQGMARGKTDVVIITDALVDVPAGVRDNFNAWKAREQAKVTTLVLDGEPGGLAEVSDVVHRVRSLGTEEAAVQQVVSI